jgi:hypothetical protein
MTSSAHFRKNLGVDGKTFEEMLFIFIIWTMFLKFLPKYIVKFSRPGDTAKKPLKTGQFQWMHQEYITLQRFYVAHLWIFSGGWGWVLAQSPWVSFNTRTAITAWHW